MSDEGVLDPWVVQWFADNPQHGPAAGEWTPELLELARGDFAMVEGPAVERVTDDVIAGRRVRVYEHGRTPRGIVVYFHGGGFCLGSIGLMDNVARDFATCADVAVVSVEYRLAPEDPYPAGLDDCEAVTLAILDDTTRFGAAHLPVFVGGESAGGTMSAGVAMRRRDAGDDRLAGQALIYPGTAGGETFPSRQEFDGVLLDAASMDWYWASYSGGRNLSGDPYATLVRAENLAGLPPAIVVLGGCDVLRDEGREYARRMVAAGVAVEEFCSPGQPHGFVNFAFPAATEAWQRVGRWIDQRLAAHV